MATGASEGSSMKIKETREMKMQRMRDYISLWRMAQQGGVKDNEPERDLPIWVTGQPVPLNRKEYFKQMDEQR